MDEILPIITLATQIPPTHTNTGGGFGFPEVRTVVKSLLSQENTSFPPMTHRLITAEVVTAVLQQGCTVTSMAHQGASSSADVPLLHPVGLCQQSYLNRMHANMETMYKDDIRADTLL